MAQTNMTIRMDEGLKKEFSDVCEAMGMSMTTAFTIFAKAVVDEERIPFDVKARNDIVASFDTMDALKDYVESL